VFVSLNIMKLVYEVYVPLQWLPGVGKLTSPLSANANVLSTTFRFMWR